MRLCGVINRDCTITRDEIAEALSCLYNKSSENREVRMIFGSIIGHIAVESDDTSVWTPSLIVSCVRGLQSMHHTHNVALKGVKRFAALVNNSEEKLWTFDDISQLLIGLQFMNAESREVKMILRAVNEKLLHLSKVSHQDIPSLRSVAVGLSGLQSMNSQSSEVKQLLSSFILFVRKINFKESYNQQADDISDCLFSLRRMSVHHREVYIFGELFSKKILTVSAEGAVVGFNNPVPFVKSILSLSNFSSDFQVTTNLLQVITKQYENECVAMGGSRLNTSDLIRLLPGFKNCTNKNRHVAACLKYIVQSVKEESDVQNFLDRNDVITPTELSNALFGLRGMSSAGENVEIIGDILDILTNCLVNLRDSTPMQFNGHDVSAMLQGFQGLSCGSTLNPITNGTSQPSSCSSKIIVFLEVLYDTVAMSADHHSTSASTPRFSAIETMTISQCSRALYGLLRVNHQSSKKIELLKNALLSRIEVVLSLKYGDDVSAHGKNITVSSEILELQRVLNLLKSVLKDEVYVKNGEFDGKVSKISDWINQFVARSIHIVKINENDHNSVLERRFLRAFLNNISNTSSHRHENCLRSEALIESNKNLLGFETDITFTNHRNDNKYIYNLEIDGPHHKKPHKDSFFKLRDGFLIENKVVNYVRRISLFKGDDPRRTRIINKSTIDKVVAEEIEHWSNCVQDYFENKGL